MNWFKFHHEAMNDAKVQTLSAEDFRAWVNLLCLASANTPRGTIPPLKHVAYVLRMTIDEATRIVNGLVAEGLLDTVDGALRPHNWDARQGRVDLSTGRSRRHRQKKKDVLRADAREAPPPALETPKELVQRPCNGRATDMQRVASRPCNGRATPLELELDGELEGETAPFTHSVPGADDNSRARGVAEIVVGAVAVGDRWIISHEHRRTIEHARRAFPGPEGERFAAVVLEQGRDIVMTLGDCDGWACYRAAIDAAAARVQSGGRAIDNLYVYCLQAANRFVANGLPSAPVAVAGVPRAPEPTQAELRRRRCDDSFASIDVTTLRAL